MASFIYPGLQVFLDPLTGNVLANGTVEMYVPGTTVDKTTYADPDGNTENANPIQLDADGQCAIWGTGLYRQIVKRSDGTQLWDRVTKVTPVTRPPDTFRTLGVHFDSLTRLANNALVATDNEDLSWFYWINFNFPPGPGEYVIWNANPDGPSNKNRVTDNNGTLSKLFADDVFYTNDYAAYWEGHSPDADNTNDWHSVLVSIHLDETGNRHGKIYIDDVDVTTGESFNGTGNFGYNGFDFYVGNLGGVVPVQFPSSGLVGDLAQFWFAPGQSLLDGSGDIPADVRAKFTSGGAPVDLGTSGELPTGTSPAIFMECRVGELPAAFTVNKGTGGAFAYTSGSSEVVASKTNPPAPTTDWPVPVVVGTPQVGQTISYSYTWPDTVISQTQRWYNSDLSVLGTGATLLIDGSQVGKFIYVVPYITDANGFWPNKSGLTAFGPVTT